MVELDRLEKERDDARKHVARLMRERDSAQAALREANERIVAHRAVIERNKTALEFASHHLDGITALEDEDSTSDGYSIACREAKRVVDSALKASIRALSDKAQGKRS